MFKTNWILILLVFISGVTSFLNTTQNLMVLYFVQYHILIYFELYYNFILDGNINIVLFSLTITCGIVAVLFYSIFFCVKLSFYFFCTKLTLYFFVQYFNFNFFYTNYFFHVTVLSFSFNIFCASV